MTKLYVPQDINKLWSELIRYDRKRKQFRATAVAFSVFVLQGTPYVPLVATRRTIERMEETGVLSYAPPKGGVDSKDKRCAEKAAARERKEEIGIEVPESAFVRLLYGPYYHHEPDVVDRFRLRRKGYGKKGCVPGTVLYPATPGKVLYSVLFVQEVIELPRVTLQEGEICHHVWVSSFKEYCTWIEGSKIKEFLIRTAQIANVWTDTVHE